MRVNTRRGKFETCPYVRGRIGIMEGRDGRFANRPYEEGGGWMVDGWRCGWGKGWVPAFVFTGAGSAREQRVGMWE